MLIDAHQHFWTLARGDYDWLTSDLPVLYRDFLPADLQPMLSDHRIDGTVAVQAAPTIAETEYLLSLAEINPWIRGVVGWVDVCNPKSARCGGRTAGHSGTRNDRA